MYSLLIIDDEPVIRRGIKSLATLRDIGISKIYEAGDADSALEIIEREKVDIVTLDINMPNTDGLTLAKHLKEQKSDIAIVMVTGYDYFEYMQSAIRIGVDDYLLKPVGKTDVEMVLKKMIDRIEKRRMERCLQELSVIDLGKQSGNFKEIADFMKEHIFDINLSLGGMAKALGFNSNYLSGVIKQIYGTPFQEYVASRRMEQAKILLLSKDMKNYEVAGAVGYEDVNYFMSKFKKTFGVTPKQFKQGVRANEI